MHVDLVPGVRLDDVASALRQQQAHLGNTRSAAAGERFDRYVQWANQAASQLSHMLKPSSVEMLVLTPVYWRLVQLLPQLTGRNLEIVDRETQECLARHEAAIKWLDGRRRVWTASHFLVADTSFFIHGPKIEEVDLRQVLGVRHEPIHWFIPIIVLDELDRLKESKDRHVRWRAGYTLAVLERVIHDPLFPGRVQDEDFSGIDVGEIPRGAVFVELVLDPPGHARLTLADDEVVDRAAALQALCGHPVCFATFDTSQAMRARGAGLQVKRLAHRAESEPEPG